MWSLYFLYLPQSLLLWLASLPYATSVLLLSSTLETGYTFFRLSGLSLQRLWAGYISPTLLVSLVRLSILFSLGLSYFWALLLGQYSLGTSTYAQGNNVDWFTIFLQYAAGMIGAAVVGGFFSWLTARAMQKKNDSDATKSDAEANRIKSDTFLNEFDKLVDNFKDMVKVRDAEIENRGKIIANQEVVIHHMRDALDYLRDQARPFTPMAVAISYEIETGKRQRPYNGSGGTSDDVTETH